MNKRLTFNCWNCKETYSLTRGLKDVRVLITACPFCAAQAQIDLTPYLSNAVNIQKGDGLENKAETFNLPAIIPTTPVQ